MSNFPIETSNLVMLENICVSFSLHSIIKSGLIRKVRNYFATKKFGK